MSFFERFFSKNDRDVLSYKGEVTSQEVFIEKWATEVVFNIEEFEDAYKAILKEYDNQDYLQKEENKNYLLSIIKRDYYHLLSLYLLSNSGKLQEIVDFLNEFNLPSEFNLLFPATVYSENIFKNTEHKLYPVLKELCEDVKYIVALAIYKYFKAGEYIYSKWTAYYDFKRDFSEIIYHNAKYVNEFLPLFEYLIDDYERIDIYLETLRVSDYNVERVDKKSFESVKSMLLKNIDEFNKKYLLQLNYDLLCFIYNQVFEYIGYDDRKQIKKIGAERITLLKVKITEVGRQPLVDSFLFLLRFKGLTDPKTYTNQWCNVVMEGVSVSKEWLNDYLSIPSKVNTNEVIKNVYTPLLTNRDCSNDDYDFAYTKVNPLVFRIQSNHEVNRTLLPYMANIINPKLVNKPYGIALHKQIYSGAFENIHNAEPKQAAQLNILVDILNCFGICAIKEIYQMQYTHFGDEAICVVNFNGIDYKLIRNDDEKFCAQLTTILQSNNLNYIVCAVPITIKGKNEKDRDYVVSSYCFCNKEQVELVEAIFDMTIVGKQMLTEGEKDFIELMESKKGIEKPSNRSPQMNWFYIDYFNQHNEGDLLVDMVEILYQTKPQKKLDAKWVKEFNQQFTKEQEQGLINHFNYIFSITKSKDFWLLEDMAIVQKNLSVIITQHLEEDKTLLLIRSLIENAYKKIPGVGAKLVAVGNFMMEMLVKSNHENAFGILNQMRNSNKYNRFVVALDKYIALFLETTTMPMQILMDKSVPSYGFSADGKKEIKVEGKGSIVLSIAGVKLIKSWEPLIGKSLKSLPVTLKEDINMTELNTYFKDLNKTLGQLKLKIRTYWLDERVWNGLEWKQYVYSHPLMGELLKGMVWSTDDGFEFIYNDDKVCVDNKGEKIDVSNEVIIRLWHPVRSTVESIIDWQKYILDNNIQQIEKQVFREWYSIIELEKEVCMQFVDHYLTDKKLMAVSNSIGWLFTYSHYGEGHPRKYLKNQDVTIHFMLDYDRHAIAHRSKEVFFSKGNTAKEDNLYNMNLVEKLPLNEVDVVVLSELFRDIDLMIATTSIVNNPDLKNEFKQFDCYLLDYQLGKLSQTGGAKTRKQILSSLYGFLGINLIGFDGNFMLIRGKDKEYKINLGSGFVQDRQTNEHIDIRIEEGSFIKDKKYRLPLFEDDTLSIIIAKAKMLTEDIYV